MILSQFDPHREKYEMCQSARLSGIVLLRQSFMPNTTMENSIINRFVIYKYKGKVEIIFLLTILSLPLTSTYTFFLSKITYFKKKHSLGSTSFKMPGECNILL